MAINNLVDNNRHLGCYPPDYSQWLNIDTNKVHFAERRYKQ